MKNYLSGLVLVGVLAVVQLVGVGRVMATDKTTTLQDKTTKRKANHLLGAQSPYLQQHVYNVVDWYPWGPEALAKAKREDKPIFLSIGYSTCHWCHVMARESFDDAEIGKYLNENFVSIKIDRERRTDLDEQFMLVTQIITGGGGWPNSIFLTPDAKPFFAGTYFPPKVFKNVLSQVNGLWKTKRSDVLGEGERIATIVRTYLARSAAAKDLTPEAVQTAAKSLLAQMDEFNGGFGAAPKFPQESALLFMLDMATRSGDRKMLDAVLLAVDGMLKGGIHDHVGGGFHRYSVDAQWDVPHFEKMLYNQAMIGRLLVKAWQATGAVRYKHAATRTFDYVLREMRDSNGGFYSAQDADSLDAKGREGEGNFYIWTEQQIVDLLGADAPFAIKALGVSDDGNFEGANVLRMPDLPGQSAKESGLSEADYLARLDGVLDKLYKARSARAAPHQDKKIVVAWSAMMIETLAEAAHSFSRPEYYQAARVATDFILENMLQKDGLKRVSFEGQSAITAQLPDYAGLGMALLALYDFAPEGEKNQRYLIKAEEIAAETMRRYASDNDSGSGAYKLSTASDGLGNFIPYDDSEIPSGNALTLSLLARLAVRTKDPVYHQKANLLAAALSGHVLDSPASGGYTLLSAMNLSLGETGSTRFIANGAVQITTNIDRDASKVNLRIRIKDGWHVNANKPLESYFIATQLAVNGKPIAPATYPEPVVKSLSFNDKPMAVYEGEILLSGHYEKLARGKAGEVVLTMQACSDKICLLPQDVKIRLW